MPRAGPRAGATRSKRRVSSLIADPVKRIFTDQAELERYADGKTDYIGDVKTASAGKGYLRVRGAIYPA